jgi:hypothetical protein
MSETKTNDRELPGSGNYQWKLTAGQLGIWNHQILHQESPIYNAGEYLEIHGDLNLEVFESALRRVISEVGAFHLRFRDEGESVLQCIDKSDDWPVPLIDFSGGPDPRATAEEWMRADTRRPFDLREGPVFREAILKIAPDVFFWYQVGHHITYDAFSASIIAARVAQVYTALLAGDHLGEALSPVSGLFKAEYAYRGSVEFERDREFWLDVLAGFRGAASVSARPGQTAAQATQRYIEPLSPHGAAELKDAAWRLGTSFGALVLAAGAIYIHRLTRAEDIVLGFTVNWRVGQEQRRTPGLAVNTLPVRIKVGRTATVASLMREVTIGIADSMRHQRYQHARIRQDIKLVNEALFSMVINVMPYDYQLSFGDCPAYAHNITNGPVDDLLVSVYDRGGDDGVEISYDLNHYRYSAGSENDVARRFGKILEWLVTADPADQAGRAEILDETERQQVLSDWNDTASGIPVVGGVHELVTGCGGGIGRGQVAKLPGTGGESGSASGLSACGRSRAGVCGGVVLAGRRGPCAGGAGRVEGRGGVLAGGSGRARGAAGVHARR